MITLRRRLRAAFAAIASALAFLAVAALPAAAQLQDENLLVMVPDGYEIGFRDHSSKQLITEMVPKGEFVEDWTEMVTVQVFRDISDKKPSDFRNRMRQIWSGSCEGAEMRDATDATENGYAAATWMLTCPLNEQTGKPEFTMFKAVGGNDALYVVQKAFTWEPTAAEVERWDRYLAGVTVCDTRRSDHACPAGQ